MPFLPKADIVLTNGRVFRGISEQVTEAIALWAGQVLAAGSSADMEPLIGPSTRVIDLAGRLATPGLCDSHMHLLPYGVIMGHVDVRASSTPTLAALLDKVRQRASVTPPGQWIQGRGYDQFELDVGRHPLREELDAAAPEHPVAIVRACGHVTICNSKALELAGIDETTPVPQGGAIEQQDGRLTGLLAETGRDRLKAVLPEPTDRELVQAIDDAGRACLSYGITSVMDAGVGMRAGYREVAAYRTAQRLGRLPGADDPMPPRRARRHRGAGLCRRDDHGRRRFHAARRAGQDFHRRQRRRPDRRHVPSPISESPRPRVLCSCTTTKWSISSTITMQRAINWPSMPSAMQPSSRPSMRSN